MPGFDGTGPAGQGPRTGGGRGFCPPLFGQTPFGTRYTPVAWPTALGGLWSRMQGWWAGMGSGMGQAGWPGVAYGRGRGRGGGFGRRGRW